MAQKNPTRKRPCRICGKWFRPDPRLGERQKTCGDGECRRLWHVRKCREWNRRNRGYFQEIYLRAKLESCPPVEAQAPPAAFPGPPSSPPLALPLVQEVIGMQQLVIIDYLQQHRLRRFQEVISMQLFESKEKSRQLLQPVSARADGQARPAPVSLPDR